jgi:hypothetical protein
LEIELQDDRNYDGNGAGRDLGLSGSGIV